MSLYCLKSSNHIARKQRRARSYIVIMLKIFRALTNAVVAMAVHLRNLFQVLSIIPLDPVVSSNREEATVLIPLIYWGTTKAIWFQILMALRFMKLGVYVVFVFDYRPATRKSVVPSLLMAVVKGHLFINLARKES